MRQIDRICAGFVEAELMDDMERYRKKALELGASHAFIVSARDIPVDERVAMKCRNPVCFGYGSSINCPPHATKPEELRKLLADYKWAVFFTMEIRPEVIVRDKSTIKERIDAYMSIFEIVSELESMAFYDGHYLAFGFGAGSCRHTFCPRESDCRALTGGRCRFSLRARPSMEAVGIDVYRMAVEAGLDIYPIGSNAKPCDIPKAALAGIVIVH